MECLKDLGSCTPFKVGDFNPCMTKGGSPSLRANFCQTGEYEGDMDLKEPGGEIKVKFGSSDV